MKSIFLLKKAARAFLPILVLGIMGTTHLYAQTLFTIGNMYYQINADGVSVTLVGPVDITEVGGELNIPTTISYNGTTIP